MAGANKTGQANTNDYVLGRGKVYFASLKADGTPDTYRFLGNAPEFTINVEVETLEHQSSQEGLKKTDKEVTISQSVGVTVTLDEINFQNMAVFFSGTSQTYTNVAGNFTDSLLSASVTLGRWYDIVDTSGNRLYDITSSADLAFGTSAASSDLVLNTDYTLDLVMGRIFLLSNAVNIMAGENLYCDYTEASTGAPETSIDEVEALTTTSVKGALKFLQINPTDADHQSEFQFHSVSLKAEGDFNLIGDDWTTMQLTGKAEASTGTNAAVSGKTLTIRTHVDA